MKYGLEVGETGVRGEEGWRRQILRWSLGLLGPALHTWYNPAPWSVARPMTGRHSHNQVTHQSTLC